MITLFDLSHVNFASNLFCSSMAVGVSPSFHIFISLGRKAYNRMVTLNPNVLLFDIGSREFQYEQFCKFKLVVQYSILLMNIDTTICDDDIAFFKNPTELLVDGIDIQVGSEAGDRTFGSTFDHTQFNVGFFRVVPSELTVALYNKWLRTAIPDSTTSDQAVFAQMITPYKHPGGTGPIQTYDLMPLLGMRNTLRVMWFDPLAVVNGRVYYLEPEETAVVARQLRITQPYVFHMSWIKPEMKQVALYAKDLWFIDEDRCIANKKLPQPWA
jgi:hypothetical protein